MLSIFHSFIGLTADITFLILSEKYSRGRGQQRPTPPQCYLGGGGQQRPTPPQYFLGGGGKQILSRGGGSAETHPAPTKLKVSRRLLPLENFIKRNLNPNFSFFQRINAIWKCMVWMSSSVWLILVELMGKLISQKLNLQPQV